MDQAERRSVLYDAVAQLEPDAHSAAVHAHVLRHYGVDLELLRIYVVLENLVVHGYLSRQRGAAPGRKGTAFYWETTGKVPVQVGYPGPPKALAAAAPLAFRPDPVGGVEDGGGAGSCGQRRAVREIVRSVQRVLSSAEDVTGARRARVPTAVIEEGWGRRRAGALLGSEQRSGGAGR